MSKKGKKIYIEGILYEKADGPVENSDGPVEKNDDIYKIDPGPTGSATQAGTDLAIEITKETTKEISKSGFQAIVSSVQTQAANLGASGLIAVGSAAGFQVEHIHDQSSKAIEKATPMIEELIDTGTIQQTIPEGHSKHGQEIPKVNSVLGIKVGDERKRHIEEKNKPEELKEAQEVMTRSARSPGVNDFGEKEASME